MSSPQFVNKRLGIVLLLSVIFFYMSVDIHVHGTVTTGVCSYLGVWCSKSDGELDDVRGLQHEKLPLAALTTSQEDRISSETRGKSASALTGKSKNFTAQQALVQQKRKRAIEINCALHPELRKMGVGKQKQMFQAKDSRIIYCSVPKTGSSNWRHIIVALEHQTNGTGRPTDRSKSKDFPRFSATRLNKRLQEEYTLFISVRHPFTRLVSAYRNKIALKYKGGIRSSFVRYAMRIAQKYRKGAHTVDYKTARNLNITWQEWVTYLTDPSERARFNGHWMEYYKLCSPCMVKYDYIVNLETVEDDSLYLLTSLGYNNKVRYPLPIYGSPRSSDALYKELFTQLSKEDIQKLYDVYKYDFELFGYPKPQILL